MSPRGVQANPPWSLRSSSARFWEKVDTSGDCWTWLGYRSRNGYGQFGVGGRVVGAHRFAYEDKVGPIPAGLHIDHLCRNPSCVNPEHLEPVTVRVNVIERATGPFADRARQTHCVHGHSLDDAYVSTGRRQCRTCAIDKERRNRERRRTAS